MKAVIRVGTSSRSSSSGSPSATVGVRTRPLAASSRIASSGSAVVTGQSLPAASRAPAMARRPKAYSRSSGSWLQVVSAMMSWATDVYPQAAWTFAVTSSSAKRAKSPGATTIR